MTRACRGAAATCGYCRDAGNLGIQLFLCKDFFLAVMLSRDSALDWAFSPTRFLYLAIRATAIQCVSGPGFRRRPSECQKAHRSARNGTEIQEFFYLKNRGLCAIGLSELLESSGKIQLIPGAPLSSVRPKKFYWRKSGPPVDRRDRSAAGEIEGQPVDQSGVFVFPN